MIPTMPNGSREVGLYLGLVFAITWGIAVAVLGFPVWFEAHFGALTNHSPLFYVAVWAPNFAAIALSLAFGGWTGLKRLLAGLIQFRFPPVWWLVSVGFFPALLAIYQAARLALGMPVAAPEAWIDAIVASVSFGVLSLGPLGEELGWRGYLLPRLIDRWGSLGAALAVGVVWVIWHIPAFFVSTVSQSQASYPAFFVSGVCISIFMTWIYNKTRGSILLAGVIPHAVANAPDARLLDYTPLQAIVFAIAGALLILVVGPKLGRTEESVGPASDDRALSPK